MTNVVNKLSRLIFLFIFPLNLFAQSNSWNVNNVQLQDNWQIQSSSKVAANDDQVSTSNFKPQNWYAAKVPSSTLGSLVDDGVFKNVFFNRNLENIPAEMFDDPWWYQIGRAHV